MKKTYEFKIELEESDYKLLDIYNFYFEKNIACYLEEVAIEMRYWIKKHRENKKGGHKA